MLKIKDVFLLGENYPNIALVVDSDIKEGDFTVFVHKATRQVLGDLLFTIDMKSCKDNYDAYSKASSALLDAYDSYKVMQN